MEILNYYEKKPNILHFQGKSPIMQRMFNDTSDDFCKKSLEKPNDLTIITTFTDKSKSPLVAQLENNEIPYINAYTLKYGLDFKMERKVYYILDALNKVETKYVLILDGYDVLIDNFDNIIDNFHTYNTRMLYNASKNNYPVCNVDKIIGRDYLGEFNHFNAGCAIGYTKDFIDFYTDCKNFMESPNYKNPFNSEQFILRNVFAKYSESITKSNPYITFDYRCTIFIALSHAYMCPNNPENTSFTAY